MSPSQNPQHLWASRGKAREGSQSVTQSRVPLLQQFHLDHLVDRGGILQPLDEGIHEVFVVAREDPQVVPGLVLQLLVPVGVQTHKDCRSAAVGDMGNNRTGVISLCPFSLLGGCNSLLLLSRELVPSKLMPCFLSQSPKGSSLKIQRQSPGSPDRR